MRWLALRMLIFAILAWASLRFVAQGQTAFGVSAAITPAHFLLLWGVFLAALLLPYLFDLRFYSKMVLILLISLVLAGTLSTRSWRSQIVTQVRERVQVPFSPEKERATTGLEKKPAISKTVKPPPRSSVRYIYRANKSGHFILFALVSFSLLTFAAPGRWGIALADVLLLAGSTEIMQFFVQGRAAGIKDFYLDAGGALLGLVFWALYRARRRSSRS